MHASEFRSAIDRLFPSRAAACRFYGASERSIRRWTSGEAPLPVTVGKLTAMLTARETTASRVDDVWMKEMGL